MNVSEYPSPTLNVEYALKKFGIYSRLFARSYDTAIEQDTLACENEEGFWSEWILAKCEEQLEEAIKDAFREFRKMFGKEKISDNSELKAKLRNALLQEGWKPKIRQIKGEMNKIRKEKRDEIRYLKQSIKNKGRKIS